MSVSIFVQQVRAQVSRAELAKNAAEAFGSALRCFDGAGIEYEFVEDLGVYILSFAASDFLLVAPQGADEDHDDAEIDEGANRQSVSPAPEDQSMCEAAPPAVPLATQAPASAPAPVAPSPFPAAPELKSGPWSAEEKQRLVEMVRAGRTSAEIGIILNRSPQGVGALTGILRDVIEGKEDHPSIPPPAKARPKAPPKMPTGTAQAFSDNPGNNARRAVSCRLDALGYQAPWNLTKDLQLVEDLVGGRKLDPTAAALRLAPELCLERWRHLLDLRKGEAPAVENQTHLLNELRDRVAVAETKNG